ncbi:MAG: thiol protease/hemagglutinin PrtT [Bacteroidetes bacterium]|nr:thiol protease/hemagglutinin PrtT [Bacteroidota bacterium]
MKKLILSVALFSQIISADAKQVTPQQAQSAAQNHVLSNTKLSLLSGANNLSLVKKENCLVNNQPNVAYYVFNVGQNNGFVIVSGDDVARPILGYSYESSFDINDINPGLEILLDNYKEQIESAIKNNTVDQTALAMWDNALNPSSDNSGMLYKKSSVAPLTVTKWNQSGGTYNKFCPPGTPSGCVAIAMAQTLKYYNYPAQGIGYNSYTDDNFGVQAANFGATVYNWTLMSTPGALSLSSMSSTQAQIDEVARLVYHVGVSVDMDYGTISGSSASVKSWGGKDVFTALTKNFGYSSSLKHAKMSTVGATTWDNTLKTELDAKRIVLIAGYSKHKVNGNSAGHLFIADGYDTLGLFHINWGWGGSTNGFFPMNALTTHSGNYTWADLQMIYEIKPGTPAKHKLKINSGTANYSAPTSATIGSKATVKTTIKNYGTAKATGQLVAALFDSKNTYVTSIQTLSNVTINQGASATYTFTSTIANIVPAKYKLGIYFVENNNWQLITRSASNTYPSNFEVKDTNPLRTTSNLVLKSNTINMFDSCYIKVGIKNGSTTTAFNGIIKASFYTLKGVLAKDIEIKQNITLGINATGQFTFKMASVGISAGTYYIVISSKATGASSYKFLSSGTVYKPTTLASVVVPESSNKLMVNDENEHSIINSGSIKNISVALFPNPATTSITIKLNELTELETSYSAEIVNLNGQSIRKFDLNSLEEQIDISDIQKGIYMIKVSHNNAIGVQKLIISQ